MKDTKDIKTLADLTPDGENFNKHTEFGSKLLEDSLRKFGAGRSILVDKDGNIIAGNGVVETAAGIGMDDVVVVQTDGKKLVVVQRTDLSLDSQEGRELALADNMTALKGIDLDLDKVRESLGDDLAKAWGMEITEPQRQATEDDFDPDKPVETVCKKGDIWKLGNHRLMCGDSTEGGDVALLMDGKKADMCFTDPPYALFGNSTGVQGVGDDKMIMPFFREINNAIKLNTKPMSHSYVCHDWQTSATIKEVFKDLVPKNLIVWKKQSAGGFGSYYTKIYELIWLFANELKKGIHGENKIKARVINGTPNIWECTIVQTPQRDHNAQKPVKIVSIAISNSSDDGDIVLDLFGGSGTTLIAAEQLNRRCFMMELDPHYCDVIIARWEKLTGNKAERISNGND